MAGNALVGALRVSLGLDSAQFEAGTKRAQNSTRNMSRGINRYAKSSQDSFARITRAAKGLAAALIGGQLARAMITTTSNFQTLGVRLEVATGSIQNANLAMTELQKIAATTPFAVEQVVDAFIMLKNLGLDPSRRSIIAYGDAAGALGKTLDDIVQGVADAATGEFERLKEFGIKARSEGDKVAFTFKGVTTTVNKSAAEIEGFLRGLFEANFAGGMEKQAETISGAFSNMKDAANQLSITITGLGFSENFVKGLKSVGDRLTFIRRQIEGIKKLSSDGKLFDTKASNILSTIGGAFAPGLKTLGGSISEFFKPAVAAVSDFSKEIERAALIQEIMATPLDMGEDPLSRFKEDVEDTVDTVETLNLALRELTSAELRMGYGDTLKDLTGGGVSQGMQDFLDNARETGAVLKNEWAGSFETLKVDLPTISSGLASAFMAAERFGDNLARGLGQALVFGQSLGDALVNSIRAAAAELVTSGLLSLLTGKGGSGGGLVSAIGGLFGFANGTPAMGAPGGLAMVGERGRELVGLPQGAKVWNNRETERMMSGASGGGETRVLVDVQPSPLFVTTVAQTSATAGAQAAAGIMARQGRSRIPGAAR